MMRAYLRPGFVNTASHTETLRLTSKLGIILGFGARDHHLARSEDQGGRLGFADTHDDGGETLRIVLRVSSVQRDRLEIQTAIDIDRRDDVSLRKTIQPQTLRLRQSWRILTAT